MPIDYDAILLPVFQEMRRLGADLSLSEYLLAVQTLRSGIGLENAAMFKQVCRLLWAKSRDEQEMFDSAFEEKAAPLLAMIVPPPELPDDTPLPEDEASPPPYEDEEDTSIHAEEKAETQAQAPHSLPLPASSPAPLPAPPKRVFHFTPRLRLGKSEMAGLWRQLRHLQPVGPIEELDVEKTILDICRYGILRAPVMHQRNDNTARLLLLVDQRGSMVPFKLLTEALIESVTRNSLPGKTTLYYFHNCPDCMLYEDPHLGYPVPIEQVLTRYARNSSVLILSDAGAMRAHYNDVRIRETEHFLKLLRSYTYLYAWLNPVPFYRWRFTSAEAIAQLVPMYPLDRDGLDDAIAILRGHPFPPEVRTHA
jgi:uncharacterized protein